MRLEKVVLNGFKSFADKTEFIFDSPITGIVGPNGCGKSNVVDAVKWVLGEQSVKSLRSGQMCDVIFSGSSSRMPVGAAEVSLFISNKTTEGTRQLPIDTDEIQITRKIYKSGESEYRINNKVCRLKDIRELFMDTGIGVKAYSIIEQGQVEQLLNASATERRAIFEEAAGISKYKAHKKEAARKLERTEQNMLRLADILAEVQKQLRSIKYQAGKARSYLEYSRKLKELQINYFLAEYAKHKSQSGAKQTELGGLEEQFAAVAAELAKHDAVLGELGNERIEAEDQLNQTANKLISLQSKIEQNLQRIEFLRSRIKELDERKISAAERADKLREKEQLLQQELQTAQKELEEGSNSLEEKTRTIDQIEEEIGKINAECASLESNLEDEKSGIIDIVRRTAQLHNEIQSLLTYRDNLSGQKGRLAGRAENSKTEVEQLLLEKAQCRTRCSQVETLLADLHQNLELKRKEITEKDKQITGKNKQLGTIREERSALESELVLLRDMEQKREGLGAAARRILQDRSAEKGRFDYLEGIVADMLLAQGEYANAAEAALEGKSDSLIVNQTDKLLADRERLGELEGRAGFICTDRLEPFADNLDLSKFEGVKGRLIEFVKIDPNYAPSVWKLLGKIIVVDSIDSAARLSKELGAGYEFVTLKGEFFGADGSVKLGPLSKAAGLISRKSRICQLEEKIVAADSEISSLQNQITSDEQSKLHIEKLCAELEDAIKKTNAEKTTAASALSAIEQDIRRLTEEQPLITSEINLLEEQIAQSVTREYESKRKLEELEAINKERTSRIKELEAAYAAQKDKQQATRDRQTILKVSLGQIAEQNKALAERIESLKEQIASAKADAEASGTEKLNCIEQAKQASNDILACESAVSDLFVEKEKRQENSTLLQKKVQELTDKYNQLQELAKAKKSRHVAIEGQINQLKIELSQLEVKNQDLVERVTDELGLDLASAYQNYHDEAVDWEKVREEIIDLRGKIERLGNVNLDAIAEQEGLEQRYEFLSSQVADLNESKAQLQQLISRLNKMSREKFSKTFEEVRVHFQQIFRKLFGGGRADILLEENDDILEAGIEIIARPPGKETRSISLLSGGEKAMTAVSLLFAVFKTKPSPFCFLDEVDAALDEANNERFNLLLREFQKESQFIVITHAKRTMSIADILYGITMQTRGVSRKISVRFDEYEPETQPESESAAVA